MDQTPSRWADWKYGAVVTAIVLGLAWLPRLSKSPADFGRDTFQALAQGRLSARGAIDWASFTAVGIDVGQVYRSLPAPKQRAAYEREFIASFAKGFEEMGGRIEDFQRWRVIEQTEQHMIVAADVPSKRKTLLLRLPAQGRKRIIAINWRSLPSGAAHHGAGRAGG